MLMISSLSVIAITILYLHFTDTLQYVTHELQELEPDNTENDKDETLDRKERVRRILNAYGNDPNVILISNHINAGGERFIYNYII